MATKLRKARIIVDGTSFNITTAKGSELDCVLHTDVDEPVKHGLSKGSARLTMTQEESTPISQPKHGFRKSKVFWTKAVSGSKCQKCGGEATVSTKRGGKTESYCPKHKNSYKE